MKIEAFTVEGPLPTEIPAIREIENAFPKHWMGFANVVVRHPIKSRYEREIDLILVTDDRVVMVDLKHWRGRLELVDGYWHQDGERREKSPVEKMRENTILLRKVFEAESFKLGRPHVDGLVVLTHPQCDTSNLAQDASAVLRLDKFLRIGNPKHYGALFTNRTPHSGNFLTDLKNREHVRRFFKPGRVFEPRRTRFRGYEVIEPNPEFWTPLFAEYLARDAENPTATALLRVWDFTKDDELRHGPERKDLATRERSVIDHLVDRNPDLASIPLRRRDGDPELGPRHWELFDRDRHLSRLTRVVAVAGEIRFDTRLELVKVLSGHVANLHRAQVAHRDLGLHSVWVDPARARVSLSNFGAAWFPERKTIGLLRTKLLGAGLTLPEDVGVVDGGTAFQQDVFLLGTVAWRLLGGEPLPEQENAPDWQELPDSGKDFVAQPLRDWFGRCLDWEPSHRFQDGVAAHDGLMEALQAGGERFGTVDLTPYETDIDPLVDYPPVSMIRKSRCRIYTTSVGEETLLVKNWPERSVGERSKHAAELIKFFARADRLRGSSSGRLPRVRMACLSQDGLFVLQDYLPGMPLEDTDVADWTPKQFQRFALLLVETIEEAHDLGVPHGDLKPENVLVAADRDPEPRVVDFLDFGTEASGERATLAYMPADGASDPFVRDRYATATIVTETAAKVAGIGAEKLVGLSKAVDACADPEAPWTTLKPLADALAERSKESVDGRLTLVIGFPRCTTPGTVLADDGRYHVVLKSEPDEISIVGFDCQLVLAFDRATMSLASVKAVEATTQTARWVDRNKALSFPGSVVVFQSICISADGLEGLLAKDEVSAWATNAIGAATGVSPAKVTEASGSLWVEHKRFPTARFWSEQIRAEEDLRPNLILVDEVVHDAKKGVALAPHDSDAALDGVEEGDAVFFNGARIGTIASEFTGAGSLAFHVSGGTRQLKPGDVLTIQPTQDAESLRRRSRAVRRILENRVPIKDLVGYFDPGTRAEPQLVGAPIKDADLDRYGFNPDQLAAFDTLWRKGPVGLLQGPPGTGKTKFISGFAHYALTKGGCRNVLLVSQSHEAVNTAAERIQSLMQDTEGGLDILRVAKDPDKISDPLRRSHVDAVHDLYVARFEAEAKERLCMIARRLGLPRSFAEDFFEVYEGPVEVARQLERLRNIDDADDDDAALLSHRIRNLEEALSAQLLRFGIEGDVDAASDEIEHFAVEALCSMHGVRDLSAVGRLRAVRETGREWGSTLRTKSRTLEEFLAGSRRLVCGTCVGVGDPRLRITDKTFDLVIVDEAARATSSELAVAMQSAHRVLLVGDHRQLPPNVDREVVKRLAVATGITDEPELLRSDFERAFRSGYGQLVGTALKRQYRMAPGIGRLVSDVFYPEVGLIDERDPPGPHYEGLPFPFDGEFAWVDSGSRLGEARRGFSFSNPSEAQIIVQMIERLADETAFLDRAKADLKEGEPLVGVICMYAQQRDLLRDMLATSSVPKEMRSLVKIETVDSYQGKENRIVVVSLVRNNERGQIGFLERENRINVALSRAMDRLVVVGAARLFRSSGGKLPVVLARMESAGRLSASVDVKTEAA